MMKGLSATLLPRMSVALFIASLPLSLILISYVWQSHNQVLEGKQQQAIYLVQRLAVTESEYIANIQRYLQRLSALFSKQEIDSPSCGSQLEQALLLNEDVSNLSIARPDGEIVCSAMPLSGHVNVADRDFLQQSLVSKRFSIGTFSIDRISQQASIGFALPIKDNRRGRVLGIVIASVSLESWSRRLGRAILPPGAVAVMVDINHTIVAHSPPNSRVIGLYAETYGYDTQQATPHGSVITRQTFDESGKDHLHAYLPLIFLREEPSLILGLSLPASESLALAKERLWQGGVVIALTLLTLLGVMFQYLKGSVVRPLQQLLDYTRSLERKTMAEVPSITGAIELRALQSQIANIAEKRVATESELQTSKARFRQIAETIQGVFWVVTPDWKHVLYVNPAYESIWQRSVKSLYRQPYSWLGSVVHEDRQQLFDYFSYLKGGDYSNIVFPLYRIERRDGTIRWIKAKGFPAYDSEGKLTSVVGIAEDVTEQKQYEAELSERETKYRLLVENADDLVVKVDTDGHFLFVSPSYCRTFGRSEHQLLGKAFMPLVHEEDQTAARETMRELTNPPFSAYLEQRALTARGWRWFGWSDTAILNDQQQVVEIIGVGRDITRQKHVELALRESETRYREVVDNMSDGVAVYQWISETDDFLITNFNRAAERMVGYSKNEVIGQKVDTIFPGVREMGLLETIRQVAKDGKPIQRPVSSYQDERIHLWFEYYVFKLPSEEIVSVFRDATKERQAIEALKRSEEKFRGFFEDLSVGLVMADHNGVTLEANKAFSQMFGIDREKQIGTSLLGLLASGMEKEVSDRLYGLVEGRQGRYRYQATYKLAGDRRLVANISIGVLQDEQESQGFIYGIAEDVTALESAQAERNKLQRELMRTYRLEALGRLAGGIAHDFNNILGAISGFVELAISRMHSAAPKTILAYLEKSQESSERAKQLIKQLLIFSRGPECQSFKPQDFNKIVANSLDMIRSLLPSSITFDVHLSEQSFPVVCDPVQVEQVLLNLCINARDAMDGKGTLHVNLESYHAKGERCVICTESVAGVWVSLLVQDSGKGITDADMERIFEPFFTTKGRDKGTGLGLSVVHGIVSSYNGHILVDSDPGKGTGFRVLLPLYNEEAELADEFESDQIQTCSAGDVSGLRVLVVDDEMPIRQLLMESLSNQGYEVVLCEDGSVAWQYLKDRAHGFDILITDQTMPHLTGIDLVRKLRAQGGSLPVLLCTGFRETIDRHLMEELDIAQCLEKPVRLDMLSCLLKKLLWTVHSVS
jgi:PAS domain S-box-containing protein